MRFDFPTLPDHPQLATARQLQAAGWTRAAINTLSSTHGRQVFPRVYCSHRGDLDQHSWLIAAFLWAGTEAVLTGLGALALQGVPLRGEARHATFVVADTRRDRLCNGARTMRTTRLPSKRWIAGVPVAGIDRALVDAARADEAEPQELRALTIRALQGRLASPERVAHELDAGRLNGTLGIRMGLDDFSRGPWSLPEVWLERLLSTKRRSYRFLANPRLSTLAGAFIGTPDGYLPQYGVAIQVHSRQYHHGLSADGKRDQWEATVEADSSYAAHGIAAVGVAPTTLRDHPERFLKRLDQVVQAQRKRPLPRIQIEPRSLARKLA